MLCNPFQKLCITWKTDIQRSLYRFNYDRSPGLVPEKNRENKAGKVLSNHKEGASIDDISYTRSFRGVMNT